MRQTIHSGLKYIGISSVKKVKDFFSENNKILMKEIEDITSKWKDLPCPFIVRMNILKMSIVSKTV
jgi:hypothetical protein